MGGVVPYRQAAVAVLNQPPVGLNHIIIIIMFIISRSMDLWNITGISSLCSINKLPPPLFLYSTSSFSSQELLLFLKSSRSVFFFFFPLLSILSFFLQLQHEEGNFFLEYGQPNWLFCQGYYFLLPFHFLNSPQEKIC